MTRQLQRPHAYAPLGRHSGTHNRGVLRRAASALAATVAVGVLATGCSSPPYASEQNRAEAARALSRVEETTLTILPGDADVLASQRVDRCADVALRNGWSGVEPSYACFAVQITVVSLPSNRTAAAAFAQQRLESSGLNARVEFGIESHTELFESAQIDYFTTRYSSLQPGWISSALSVGPSTYDFIDTGDARRGSDAEFFLNEGDALLATRAQDRVTVECECVQWWVIAGEPYWLTSSDTGE